MAPRERRFDRCAEAWYDPRDKLGRELNLANSGDTTLIVVMALWGQHESRGNRVRASFCSPDGCIRQHTWHGGR